MPQTRPPIHFVGSLPLPSPTETFTLLSRCLPENTPKRLPDGEPGARNNFTAWQWQVLGPQGLQPAFMYFDTADQQSWRDDWTAAEIQEVMRAVPEVLETGYDAAALESWTGFQQAQRDGLVAKETRFQVSVPTPTNWIPFGLQPAFQSRVEPRYAAGLEQAVRRIQDVVPHTQLAIQLDLAVEFALLHGAWYTRNLDAQAFVHGGREEMMTALVEKVVRLAGAVEENVELGFHCCYGDVRGKYFLEPPDTSMIATVMLRVLEELKRSVGWVHFPMPREREDEAYLEPMNHLLEKLDDSTDVFVGLVHADDLEGTKRRMESARKVFGDRVFGIATECGIARKSEAQFESILKIMREVSRA